MKVVQLSEEQYNLLSSDLAALIGKLEDNNDTKGIVSRLEKVFQSTEASFGISKDFQSKSNQLIDKFDAVRKLLIADLQKVESGLNEEAFRTLEKRTHESREFLVEAVKMTGKATAKEIANYTNKAVKHFEDRVKNTEIDFDEKMHKKLRQFFETEFDINNKHVLPKIRESLQEQKQTITELKEVNTVLLSASKLVKKLRYFLVGVGFIGGITLGSGITYLVINPEKPNSPVGAKSSDSADFYEEIH